MKQKGYLFLLLLFFVINLNAQDFVIPDSYISEKKTEYMYPMECTGSINGNLVFYCNEIQKYFLKKKDSLIPLDIKERKLKGYEHACMDEIFDDMTLWRGFSISVDSQRFVCFKGDDIIFDHTFPYSYEDKFYKSGFFNAGKSLFFKSFCNPWLEYGRDRDSVFFYTDLGLPLKKRVIKNSLMVFPLGEKIFYSKYKSVVYKDLGIEYETMDIYCINDGGKEQIIAKDSELLMVSIDGKYLLAEKKLFGKSVPIIIDLDKNKCVYLLGQKYRSRYFYYDVEKDAFCYDMGDKIQCFPCDSKKFIYDPKIEFSIYKSDCDKFWESH